jgi:hypothetical protein
LNGGEWCGSPEQQSRKGGKLGGREMRTLKREKLIHSQQIFQLLSRKKENLINNCEHNFC